MKQSSYKLELLHVVVLIVIVVLCYAQTVHYYFVADDLWQVHYAYRIAGGDWDLFFRNLIGNYIQIPGFDFYRPLLGLTFLADYQLWKINPFGYHLTSIMLYPANVVLFYFVVFELVNKFSPVQIAEVPPDASNEPTSPAIQSGCSGTYGRSAAFWAAAAFATTPLHCEAVTWLSGRADVLAGCFYLLALYLVLIEQELNERLKIGLALSSFVLALCSKEIAIGLPVVIAAYYFLLNPESWKTLEIRQKLLTALRHSWPFFAIAVLYLAVRFICFGNFFGGYGGAFGTAKANYAMMQWFDLRMWLRVLLPFSTSALNSVAIFEIAGLAALVSMVVLAGVRLLTGKAPVRLLIFICVWMATALLPVAFVWGLDSFLHNSRLLFFFTMGLSSFLPIILFSESGANPPQKYGSVFRSLSCTVCGVLVIVFGIATVLNSQIWQTAGFVVQSVKRQCSELTDQLDGKQRIVILGIPDDYKGAMVILNGSTLHHLLSPPFCKSNVFEKVESFKPFIIGSSSYINATRMKRLLRTPGLISGIHVWNEETLAFDHVKPSVDGAVASEVPLPITGSGGKLDAENLHVSPVSVDYLRLLLKPGTERPMVPVLAPLAVQWNSDPMNRSMGAIRIAGPLPSKGLNIALSQNWRWYGKPVIEKIEIALDGSDFVEVERADLLPLERLAPVAGLPDAPLRTSGEYVVPPGPVNFSWNAASIPGAGAVVVEVSHVNYFFESIDKVGRSKTIATTKTFALPAGTNVLEQAWFPHEGFYEIRVLALDARGLPIGEYSDPVTIYRGGVSKNAYLD